jgi:hypothetical protein
LSGCSNSAFAPKYVFHIRNFPTSPLELARPFGWLDEFEFRSRRGVSPPFAHRTTALARCRCICFLLSKYETPRARPLASVSTRAT